MPVDLSQLQLTLSALHDKQRVKELTAAFLSMARDAIRMQALEAALVTMAKAQEMAGPRQVKDSPLKTSKEARQYLKMGKTHWIACVGSGMIPAFDANSKTHLFTLADLIDFTQIPSGERRRRIAEWKRRKKS